MPKFRFNEQYLMKVWYEKVVEIEADDEEHAEEKYREGDENIDYKIISDEEIDSEHDTWSEIIDIQQID